MLLFLLASFSGFFVSLGRRLVLVGVADVAGVLAHDVPDRLDGGLPLIEDLQGSIKKNYGKYTGKPKRFKIHKL